MSLKINTDHVVSIKLVSLSQWIDIVPGSFDLDAYEYVDPDGRLLLGGGQVEGVPNTGFTCTTIGLDHQPKTLVGPVTSIAALQLDPHPKEKTR